MRATPCTRPTDLAPRRRTRLVVDSQPARVLEALRVLRTDTDSATRHSALAALARLGERAALAEITGGLSSEEPSIRVSTAALVAEAELTWLWPELQDVADSTDPETAFAATEALERLRENLLGTLG